MKPKYIGLEAINDALIFLKNVDNVGFDEVVTIEMEDGSLRHGQVVEIIGDNVAVQVFEGTKGMSLNNTKATFQGRPMQIGLSKEVRSYF